MKYKTFSGLWEIVMGAYTFILSLHATIPDLKIIGTMLGTLVIGVGLNKIYEIIVDGKQR